MNVRTPDAKTASLFFLVAAPPLSYLFSVGNVISYCVGVLFFICAYIQGEIKFPTGPGRLGLLLLFLPMSALSLVLLLFGTSGEFASRYIFAYSVFQLMTLILLFSINNENAAHRIAGALFLAALLEGVVIIGQFLYVTYGFGFSKIAEYDNSYGLLTGSMGNPNDSATYVGVLTFAVSVFLSVKRYYGYAYVCLLTALPPIFLTLSRTMLVFWLANLLVVYLSASFGENRAKRSINYLFALAILLICVAFYIYSGEIDSEVFNRSIERISLLSGVGADESTGFRRTSLLRLVENIDDLGLGSFSDLNYYKFYDASDDWLIKVNPHSYIVEYSFLFGYPGFFVIISIFATLAVLIFSNRNVSLSFRMLACFGLFAIQAVPASLVIAVYFFPPFIFLANLTAVQEGRHRGA